MRAVRWWGTCGQDGAPAPDPGGRVDAADAGRRRGRQPASLGALEGLCRHAERSLQALGTLDKVECNRLKFAPERAEAPKKPEKFRVDPGNLELAVSTVRPEGTALRREFRSPLSLSRGQNGARDWSSERPVHPIAEVVAWE